MKRKLFCVCLIVLFTLGFAIPASADMLWEPYDDAYFQKNYQTLDYMDQTYVVPDGLTVNFYEDPVQGGLTQTLQPGTKVYVGPYGTINGEVWACGHILGDWHSEGWFRLNRLQKVYSHEDFVNDFGDSFTSCPDKLTQEDIAIEVLTWTYPGSGTIDGTIPKEALQTGYNDGILEFSQLYTDPNGGRWGYVGYFMGQCGWVYLDAPEASDAPVFPQAAENTVTDTTQEEEPGGNALLWIILPVVAVTAVTAVIIIRLKKRTQQ